MKYQLKLQLKTYVGLIKRADRLNIDPDELAERIISEHLARTPENLDWVRSIDKNFTLG